MTSTKIHMTCGYCSTGCSMLYDPEKEGPFNVTANPDYPVNLGKACQKGFRMLGHLDADDRARTPYLRDTSGNLRPTDWNTALKTFTDRFKGIQQKHGKEAIAFISTGQISNEEHALLGALAKFGMGIIHGDGNTRQCMASAVVAYKQSFGWDVPPFTYKDFEESDVLVFVGSNPVIAHPVMWNRVKMNQHEPKIVVIDPRLSETAREATHHYPIQPKSELTFLYSVANVLIREGWIDRDYIDKNTDGFDDFKKHVSKFSPADAATKVGLPAGCIEELAKIIDEGERVSFWWMVGVNQAHQATRTAQAIINLALMTGNMGKPGTGANSITGQCNAMGSRIFSNTTALLGGHRFEDAGHRMKVADVLNIDVNRIPDRGSLPYEKILDAVDEGKIKGLWFVCTNPVHSWIDNSRISSTFKKLDFIVVQDMFHTTETARLAHLVLPAAGNGEKLGTFINSERRIGVLQPARRPPGDALPDFDIFLKIAERWGCGDMFTRWKDPETAFHVIKQLTKGLPWDFTGIKSYTEIIENGGIQWPYPENMPVPVVQERRLFEDGKFLLPDGKAKFLFEDVLPAPETPDQDYPIVLLTGRGTVVQWQTQTRTTKVPLLARSTPKDPYIEMNPGDAKLGGIADGNWVIVSSRRGTSRVRAVVTDASLPGRAFMPMHYIETNRLTYPSFDAHSHEPMYKYSTIKIQKA